MGIPFSCITLGQPTQAFLKDPVASRFAIQGETKRVGGNSLPFYDVYYLSRNWLAFHPQPSKRTIVLSLFYFTLRQPIISSSAPLQLRVLGGLFLRAGNGRPNFEGGRKTFGEPSCWPNFFLGGRQQRGRERRRRRGKTRAALAAAKEAAAKEN